jgi:hypothetical protein
MVRNAGVVARLQCPNYLNSERTIRTWNTTFRKGALAARQHNDAESGDNDQPHGPPP